MVFGTIILSLFCLTSSIDFPTRQHSPYKDPHFVHGRKAMVHLFEWKWDDIADECERFLGPMGYGGIQVSPPSENIILPNRPWYERYQVVSYKLITRSGNETQFRNMVKKCNDVGVRIYPDVIINHMTGGGGGGYGTAGTYFNADQLQFPGVPYSPYDFNSCNKCPTSSCDIENFADPRQARDCRLVGLKDLDQSKDYVRTKLEEFLNHLISIGVAGFRIDAAKHIYPEDLRIIYDSLNDLNTKFFPQNSRPFIYQEVVDMGGEGISRNEYVGLGRVTEFIYGMKLGTIFHRRDQLKRLNNFGQPWGMLADGDALVFIDNHDNQRSHGGGGEILTHKTSRLYKMATAFMLSWPYGVPRVMSSFAFDTDQAGPPHDAKGNILTVGINPDMTCRDGWICEHRWRQIYNMVRFGKVVGDAGINVWWSAHNHQIAFSRGNRGFIAINNEDFPLKANIHTNLPPGKYCDVISGYVINGKCSGRVIVVNDDTSVDLDISETWEDTMIAIHVEAKLA